MKLIRKSTNETVQLEDGFLWTDEFDWKPIEQKLERSISGEAIIQEGLKQSGRPISLEPADQNTGWIKLRDLRRVRDWAVLHERYIIQFEQQHDTRQFEVIFNHEAGALEAKPVLGIPAVSLDDYFNVTLRFLELENAD